ncbi:MAG: hypothetical protein ACI8XM_001420 [Haloarculaceae archaeon]|jgi:hypothetical protein
MDMNRQRELLPHYLAILCLVILVLAAIRLTLGDVGLPGNLAGVVVVVLLYPTVVRALGVAPSRWDDR